MWSSAVTLSAAAAVPPASPVAHDAPADAPAVVADVPAADPVARYGATHGLHPDVQAFAFHADNNGGSGGARKASKSTPVAPAPAPLKVTTAEVFDVSKTPQSIIDELKKSPDAATRRLGRTIENAKAAYGDLLALPQPATIKVKLSDGNGGQPVMVITGPGFKDDQYHPATIHTHYHGDNATVADPLGSKAGTNARIRETLAAHPQTVFVLPEASNTRDGADSPQNDGHFDYQDVGWRGVKSQSATTDDALTAAGVHYRGEEVVSFHSGGGKVVRALMEADKGTGTALRANRLELHDCLYGTDKYDWSKGPDRRGWEQSFANWGATANGKAVRQVVYYHGTNEAPRQNILKSTFGDKFTPVEMGRQGPSGPVNPLFVDANGKSWKRTEYGKRPDGTTVKWTVDVRKFEDDPHYRTTGQFLAADPPPLPSPPSHMPTQAIPQVHRGRTDRPE
jgi:hypothetical protein